MEDIKAKALLVIEESGDYYVIPSDALVRFRVSEDQKAELNKLFGDEVAGYKAYAEGKFPAAMSAPGRPAAMSAPGQPKAMGFPAAEGIHTPQVEWGHFPAALWIGWPVKY